MADVWYFAYGSNVNPEQMKERIGEFKEAVKATLIGFKLVFRGYSPRWNGAPADIEPSRESVVYGVLYRISEDQLKELDSYEGFPNFYKHEMVEVLTEAGRKIQAVTYVRTRKEPCSKPSKRYVETIIRGLRAHGYSEKIIQEVLKEIERYGITYVKLNIQLVD